MKSKSGTIPTSEKLRNSTNEKSESTKSTLGKTANSTNENLRTEKRSNNSNARKDDDIQKEPISKQNFETNLSNIIPAGDGVIGIRTSNVLVLMNEVSDLKNAPEAAKSDIKVASRFLKIVYDEI